MSANPIGEFSGRDLSDLTCEEKVDDPGGWYSHTCGRRAKGEIRPDSRPGAMIKVLCGMHLAAHNRRAAKDAETALARGEVARHNRAVEERISELSIRLGVLVGVYKTGPGRHSDRSVLVSVESLEHLADRLGILREEADAAIRKAQQHHARAEKAERERDDALDRVTVGAREIDAQAAEIARLEGLASRDEASMLAAGERITELMHVLSYLGHSSEAVATVTKILRGER